MGGFWRIPWLLIFYLIAMLILIILLASLVVFIYMVTIRGSGHIAPSRAYLEYHLDDFSGWLRRRVQSSYKWDRIRSCLSSTSMCADFPVRLDVSSLLLTCRWWITCLLLVLGHVACEYQLSMTWCTSDTSRACEK